MRDFYQMAKLNINEHDFLVASFVSAHKECTCVIGMEQARAEFNKEDFAPDNVFQNMVNHWR